MQILARFCVDRRGNTSGEWDVGGPDVLSYREIADLAFAALRRRPRTVVMPAGLLDATVWVASRLGDRPRDLATFFAEGLTRDAIGTRTGSRHLADHFDELAAASRATPDSV